MTTTETLILEQLAAINSKLEALLVPVAQQIGKQMGRMSPEERKIANKQATEDAKRRMRAR